MTDSPLDLALQDYDSTLRALDDRPADEQILAVLRARDGVQAVLMKTLNNEQYPCQDELQALRQLLELDQKLKDKAKSGNWVNRVDTLRESLGRSENSWWWFSEKLQQGHSLGLDILNFILLVPTVTLIIDTSSRLLSVNFGFIGTFTIVLQSLLGLIAGKLSLSNSEEFLNRFILHLGIRRNRLSWVKLSITFLILLFVSFIYQIVLPWRSRQLLQSGTQNYEKGFYAAAKENLSAAIELDPQNWQAKNKLGEVYEAVDESKEAEKLYKLAMENDLIAAYNNLGRLYLIRATEENKSYFATTFVFINRAKGKLESHDSRDSDSNYTYKDEYDNYTLLSWAYLERSRVQTKLDEQLRDINNAIRYSYFPITLDNKQKSNELSFKLLKNAAPYCIRAEAVGEKKRLTHDSLEPDEQVVKQLWNTCFDELEKRQDNLQPYERDWYEQSKKFN